MGERVALIEVLEHDGRVLHAVPVAQWPCSLGRAMDCDVVLHDPHVAAHHAVLEPGNDGLVLRVGESVNGAGWNGRRLGAGESGVLPEGAVLTIGRTELRVRRIGEALAAEEPLLLPGHHRRTGLTVLAGVVLFAWLAAVLWLDNDPGARWDDYLPMLLGSVLGAALWCALWGLGSKIFQRRFVFMPHLRVLLGFALASLVADAVLAIASFMLGMPVLSHLRGWVSVGMGAALLASHARLLLPTRTRTIALVFGAFAIMGIGINAALDWRHTDRVFSELYATTLPPPALRLASAKPTASLIEELRGLKGQLDQRAKDDESDAAPEPETDADPGQ